MNASENHSVAVEKLYRSPGHDFYGRHRKGRKNHVIEDCCELDLVAKHGVLGDRFFDYKKDYKGQITFFDERVYQAVKQEFFLSTLPASAFRRNVLLSGIDLNALIGKEFSFAGLRFSGSEEARPCYWMDEACAPGVEDFLKGRGGLRCRILRSGTLRKGFAELKIEA